MNSEILDPRFCQAAMDGLKSYPRIEFARLFLDGQGVDCTGNTLRAMWNCIEELVARDPTRCRDLWEYVDNLKMWGRQRIFLYEVDDELATQLLQPSRIRGLENLYDEPLYQWEAATPFVARVCYENDGQLLVMKIIETREFERLFDGQLTTFEERAINFFIVDLQNHYAELRLQELPTGAKLGLNEEHDRLWKVVGRYLDKQCFNRIELEPVMDTILRKPPYKVAHTVLRFTESELKPDVPELASFFNKLFRRPIPIEVSCIWECNQDVLGKKELHFRYSGPSDYLEFGGLADPVRIRDILKDAVGISRGNVIPRRIDEKTDEKPGTPKPKKLTRLDKTLDAFKDQPAAQAVVLSAGAIAAAVIWVFMEGIGSYVYDEALERVLRGRPLIVITVPVEIGWTFFFYGWRRVWRGFKALGSLSRRRVWAELKAARKRRKEMPQ